MKKADVCGSEEKRCLGVKKKIPYKEKDNIKYKYNKETTYKNKLRN